MFLELEIRACHCWCVFSSFLAGFHSSFLICVFIQYKLILVCQESTYQNPHLVWSIFSLTANNIEREGTFEKMCVRLDSQTS